VRKDIRGHVTNWPWVKPCHSQATSLHKWVVGTLEGQIPFRHNYNIAIILWFMYVKRRLYWFVCAGGALYRRLKARKIDSSLEMTPSLTDSDTPPGRSCCNS